MLTVKLQQLRYFDAVAADGQVSLAAQRLYITQPALSQALRQLERDVIPLVRARCRDQGIGGGRWASV